MNLPATPEIRILLLEIENANLRRELAMAIAHYRMMGKEPRLAKMLREIREGLTAPTFEEEKDDDS